jgi:predicted DNA-binding protein (MmcQ/YjbR family)
MTKTTGDDLLGLVEELRELCAKLPGAEEYVMVHHPTFRLGKKPFVVAGLGKTPGKTLVSINLGHEAQSSLLDDSRFIRTPYMGHNGWVSIAREDVKRGQLAELVTASWSRIAGPKHLAERELGSRSPSKATTTKARKRSRPAGR